MIRSDQTSCKSCGNPILLTTSAKNKGECIPCKKGYHDSIEAGKKRFEYEKQLLNAPQAVYWRSLVNRVRRGEGFNSLPEAEKLYFAICLLEGDVYNGGFEFFFNTSGDYYQFAVRGLKDLNAEVSLSLLLEAKELLFGKGEISDDLSLMRRRLFELETNSSASETARALDILDSQFYEDPDSLSDLIYQFALENKLWVESS